MHFKLKKGLDIPISGSPRQSIEEDVREVASVAVLGQDYIGLKPTMMVAEGDRVKLGQALFEDKKNPGVLVTSPGSGVVAGIHRGEKRALRSVVIELDGDDQESFAARDPGELGRLDPQHARETLIQSGLWCAFRTRPYSKVPKVGDTPDSIFVPVMDSNPLALDPVVVVKEHADDFVAGLKVLSRITEGTVHVCAAPQASLPELNVERVTTSYFEGPHPAGIVGTHIHFLSPVSAERTVWHVNHQDVIAIGKLFTSGKLWVERVVSLAGPIVHEPRLVRARLGANTEDLVREELEHCDSRVISGSVLNGRRCVGPVSFLGRYHLQVSAMREGRERQFLGWLAPGSDKFSAINVFVSALQRGKRLFALNTSQNGSPRAMVPIGNYEEVVPLDVLPTQLLRALLVRDTDAAQKLGCLELDEEDVSLCSFVCAGKYEFGPVLRSNLSQIEREG